MNRIDIAKKLRIVKQFGGWEELKHGLLVFFKICYQYFKNKFEYFTYCDQNKSTPKKQLKNLVRIFSVSIKIYLVLTYLPQIHKTRITIISIFVHYVINLSFKNNFDFKLTWNIVIIFF